MIETIQTTDGPSYDVVVVGGGIAGISAALASSRHGANTLLIENSYILGGLATSGIVTFYLPLCDGMGKQMSFGIAEELLRLSVKYGVDEENFREDWYPEAWLNPTSENVEARKLHRYQTNFNPSLFAIEAEKLLREVGVHILYGTKVCAVNVTGDRVDKIITENKSGRMAIGANAVVDASGDADVFRFSGVETDSFEAGNILASWYYGFNGEDVNLVMLGYCENPHAKFDESFRFGGMDAFQNSDVVCMTHQNILNDFIKKRKANSKFKPAIIPTIPQIRMTQKIKGGYEIDETDSHKHFDSSIGMIGNWKENGPAYEIPFECLYTKELGNVFAAGRCISCTQAMWDVVRVIPPCAVTGEASGTAAAMLKTDEKVDVKRLQENLVKAGVRLYYEF